MKARPCWLTGVSLPSSGTQAKYLLDREMRQLSTAPNPGTLLFLPASTASFGGGATTSPERTPCPAVRSLSLSWQTFLADCLAQYPALALWEWFPQPPSLAVVALQLWPSRTAGLTRSLGSRAASIITGWRWDRGRDGHRLSPLPCICAGTNSFPTLSGAQSQEWGGVSQSVHGEAERSARDVKGTYPAWSKAPWPWELVWAPTLLLAPSIAQAQVATSPKVDFQGETPLPEQLRVNTGHKVVHRQ